MVEISTYLSGVKLRNPTILAAGILGVAFATLDRVANSGAGAVTTKSIGPEKRKGHPNPVVVETPCGLLNAVGLSCPSPEESMEELKKAVKELDVPVIASFYAHSEKGFGQLAEKISEAKPAFLEANISCPNVESEFGSAFGTDSKASARIVASIKNSTKVPLIVKLTPNVTNIREIARAVEDAGADAITAINTYGPGMAIDAQAGKPVLVNKFGGLSGPAIKPIALRCVYELYEEVKIPIIGTGGIQTGTDMAEMLMAGASACGIGTAVMSSGIEVFSEICSELEEFMDGNGYSRVSELMGLAHE